MDPLSEVFTLLQVQSVLSARIEAAGPWALRFPSYQHIKFGGVIEGHRWLWIERSRERFELEPGDFYLLTDGRPYCFASDPAATPQDGLRVLQEHQCADGVVRFGTGTPRTVGAGGRFSFNQDMSTWLLELLPPVIVVRGEAAHARALQPTLELIRIETESLRPGMAAIAASLASIVLVNILRAHMASDTAPAGWLGALTDPKVGAALRLMHADIRRSWKLSELASTVGMSRTSFAERFRQRVGIPPLEYLTRWRMALARQTIATNAEPLASVAASVGYSSETAFSLAFKRMFGESPGRYRAKTRASESAMYAERTTMRKTSMD